MTDYIVCFIFWCVFVFFLYAFGNVLVVGKTAQSVKLIAGYLGYSFLVAVGGIIIQLMNLKWIVFGIYMIAIFAGISGVILNAKRKRGKIFSSSLKEYIQQYWLLYIVCMVLTSMLFCYFRPFWYGNHLDDGYYLTKVATLPFEAEPFRTNYSVGVGKAAIDSYIFNTWELEASFFVRILNVNVVLFLRLFQSAYHYFILLNCIHAFGYKIVTKVNDKIEAKNLQYMIGPVLVFFIYYVYLMDTGLFFVRDMFHLDAAMYYGASLIKMVAIMFLLLFYIEEEKINYKMIIGVGIISVVMISKTGIVLPVIFIIVLACSMVWLFENNDKKIKILSVLLGLLCGIAGILIPAGIDEQKEVYKFVLTTLRSPVVVICIIIFLFSFRMKNKIVYRVNKILLISGAMMLIPQINDLFEFISFYSFVAARAWSTYVYTFVLVCMFYLYLILREFMNDRAVKGIYLFLTLICTVLMVHGYELDGGELFVSDDLPANTDILQDMKVIYHNHYFIPNSTIELGNALESLSKESEQQLLVASPQWAGIDGTVHTLATQLRIFAPSVISLSASERYPVESDHSLYGYDQSKYEDFFNIPGSYTLKSFKQEVEKYQINCIVTQNDQRAEDLENMGFTCRYTIQEGVYYVWYKINR